MFAYVNNGGTIFIFLYSGILHGSKKNSQMSLNKIAKCVVFAMNESRHQGSTCKQIQAVNRRMNDKER